MTTWTDELKAKAVEAYEAADPTPETSAEIVVSIAEELGQSPNGVRAILAKAGVYIKATPKKTGTTAASTAAKKEGAAPKVSKADCVDALVAAINDIGQEPDMDIIEKLTGKAAQYFTTLLRSTGG